MKASETKISVIMPIYNAAEFLAESIGDILQQDFRDFELICVNDGSTDGSCGIIRSFQEEDSRVKVLEQTNAGGGAARNRGMDAASGKYLLFLDADDRFEPDLLSSVWMRAEETYADIVIFEGECFQYDTGRVRAADWLLDRNYLTEVYLDGHVIREEKIDQILYRITNSTVWNKAYKRESLASCGIRFQEIYVVDSLYFVMTAMAMADRIAVLEKKLIHYRENVPTGQLVNHHKSSTGVFDALCAVKDTLQREGRFEALQCTFLDYGIDNCLERIGRLGTREAEQALYEALHRGGLEKLGLKFTGENQNLLSSEMHWERCKQIHDMPYIDYLHQKQHMLKQMVNGTGNVYALPKELIAGRKKVAVYGAGNVGKSYFAHLLNSSEHKLIGWFDKAYASYGYPVKPPEKLSEQDADAVLISVKMETAAEAIRGELQKMGIPDEKIFWKEPVAL